MNNISTPSELFATNQVSTNTECRYKRLPCHVYCVQVTFPGKYTHMVEYNLIKSQ